MPIIGPQVYPGGWKVIDKEEAEVLLALQVPIKGWYMPSPGWWEDAGIGPWSVTPHRLQHIDAHFFVRESNDGG